MKWRPIQTVVLVAALVSVVFASSNARAQSFPCATVRIIVPYATGGPSDTGVRLVARPMSAFLGANIVVENRGGAGGLTGTEQVARLPADGCTLLLGAVGPLVFIPAERKLSYDPQADFTPLGLIWQSPLVLVVNPKLGVKTVAELVKYAKERPDKVSFASAGIGTNTHMASELFKREAGISLLHVPYKGTGAALPDLIGGQVDSIISDVATMAPQIRDNQLVGIAVTAPERSALLPDVPTMAEVGFPGARTENWYGLLVRSDTPPQLVSQLKDALNKAIATEEFRKALALQGAAVRDVGPEAFSRLIDAETKRWVPIIREAGIKF